MSEGKEQKLDLFGKEFGRYHVGQKLGEGGYALVYRANEPEIDREVALKILKPNSRGEYAEIVSKRFMREARLVAGLKDHHTIQLYDYGEEKGLLYMAFEFVEGETLGERLEREGALKPLLVVKVLEQILEALEEAHDRGILHRDIKPGNIMVYDHGRRGLQVKVLDFGIGKFVRGKQKITQLTQEGRMIGTPRYMSPEQMKGDDNLGPACDLWAVGMLAYEALTGKQAIRTDDLMAVTSRILDSSTFELPEDLGVPEFLREMVAKLLRKDVERRYQSAGEVLRDLEEFKTMATTEHQAEELEAKLQRELDKTVQEESALREELDDEPPSLPSFGVARETPRTVDVAAVQVAKKAEKDTAVSWQRMVGVAVAVVALVTGVWAMTGVDKPNKEVPDFLKKQATPAAVVETGTEVAEEVPGVLEESEEKAVPTPTQLQEQPSKKTQRVVAPPVQASAKKEEAAKEPVDAKVETVAAKPRQVVKTTKEDNRPKVSKSPQKTAEKEDREKPAKETQEVAKDALEEKETQTKPAEEKEAETSKEANDSEETKLRIWGVE